MAAGNVSQITTSEQSELVYEDNGDVSNFRARLTVNILPYLTLVIKRR